MHNYKSFIIITITHFFVCSNIIRAAADTDKQEYRVAQAPSNQTMHSAANQQHQEAPSLQRYLQRRQRCNLWFVCLMGCCYACSHICCSPCEKRSEHTKLI